MDKELILQKIETLQPGDIILQLGDNPITEIIRRYDRGNYSHVRLYCGKNDKGEHETMEMGFRGVRKYEIFEGFKSLHAKQFRGFRHTLLNENPNKVQDLIKIAENYAKQSFYASRNQIDLLAKILSADYFIENLPYPKRLRLIYEKAFHVLIKARKDNKSMFTCSGFIYQIFYDLGYPIKNNRFEFPPTYRSIDKEENFSEILNKIDYFSDDDSFVSFLLENDFLNEEVSDDALEKILNGLGEDFMTLEEDKQLNNLAGTNYRSIGFLNSEENRKEIEKVIISKDLFFILYDQLLNANKYAGIKDGERLVEQKSIKEILQEYKSKKLHDYSKHTFFTPSDIAISSSLEPIFGITKINYNEL